MSTTTCLCQISPGLHRVHSPLCPVHGGEPDRDDDGWKDELITFDPDDPDTYPSVCAEGGEVKARFGWTGGEQFTHRQVEGWLLGDKESPLEPNVCLDSHKGGCRGKVLYRPSLTGTGTQIQRCDAHWEARLEWQEEHEQVYPDSPIAPAWFDPEAAGERWDDDY